MAGKPQWEQVDSDDDSAVSYESDDQATSSSPEDAEEDERDGTRTNYAQFQGESDEEEAESSDEGDDSEDDGGDGHNQADANASSHGQGADPEAQIRKKMANIPFSALVKARKSIDAPASDEEDFSGEEDEWAADRARARAKGKAPVRGGGVDDDDDDDDEQEAKRREVKERLKALSRGRSHQNDAQLGSDTDSDGRPHPRASSPSSTAHRPQHEKRANKHAPTEVSSRKPVSRKRSVIDSTDTQRAPVRDPRFSNLSGPEINSGLFRRSYGFVDDMQSQELSTLKATLSKLRKMEANHAGPKASSASAMQIRSEREQVERTLKREEAKAAERSRRERERQVLSKFRSENEERVKSGGKRFYLKDSDKKKMFLQDKFDRLAAPGKRGSAAGGLDATASPAATTTTSSSSSKALRKAVDKRRRKNAAKERKSMPFLEGGRRGPAQSGPAGSGGPVPQRKRRAAGEIGGNKRNRRA